MGLRVWGDVFGFRGFGDIRFPLQGLEPCKRSGAASPILRARYKDNTGRCLSCSPQTHNMVDYSPCIRGYSSYNRGFVTVRVHANQQGLQGPWSSNPQKPGPLHQVGPPATLQFCAMAT